MSRGAHLGPRIVKLFGTPDAASGNNTPVALLANSSGVLYVQNVTGIGPGGTSITSAAILPNNADGVSAATNGQVSNSDLYVFNGTSWDRARGANVFKTVSTAAAGLTAVWTPTAGKKFRLMGYTIDVAGTLAATGTQVLTLRDGAVTVIKNHVANLIQTQTANISGGDSHMGCDLGQGQLSALANNVLNINLGTAMATGAVIVNAWGTEE